jgi:uncharacterized protein (TIGR03086 family)
VTAELALLARATGYALEGLAEVDATDLDRPTPCPEWDLRALLLHVADAADGLAALVRTGELALPRPARSGDADPVAVAGERVLHLLDVVTRAAADGDRAGRASAAARNGAVELTAHGWDVATALGSGRPMPPGLAAEVLALASSLLPAGVRPELFAAPVDLPATAPAEDRLVAFLGRRAAVRAAGPAAGPAGGPAAPGVSGSVS